MEQLKKILNNDKEHILMITTLYIENKFLKEQIEYLKKDIERYYDE